VKFELRITSPAYRDLSRQTNYLLRVAPRIAERFSRAVYQTIKRIQASPDRGERALFETPGLEDLRYLMVRELPSYIVWYRVTGTQIKIVRVLHSAQDAEAQLGN
jgi:toxin ParE1/3/4